MTEEELAEADVTCHTDDCGNAEIPLRVLIHVENPQVVCGPCGQPITDIAREETQQ